MGGMSREEIEAGNKTVYVFSLAILFVFWYLFALVRKAGRYLLLYCSVCRPACSGLLPLPICSISRIIFTSDWYTRRLSACCQERHLIIEYAKVRVDERYGSRISDNRSSKNPSRPIIATSLAFVVGSTFPWPSPQAGAASRVTMGITVVFGIHCDHLRHIPSFRCCSSS